MPEESKWPVVVVIRGVEDSPQSALGLVTAASNLAAQYEDHTGYETERYVPLSSIRERLFSDAVVEAAARSTWKVNGWLKGEPDWPPDRKTWLDEARRDLSAVLAAAFPELPDAS